MSKDIQQSNLEVIVLIVLCMIAGASFHGKSLQDFKIVEALEAFKQQPDPPQGNSDPDLFTREHSLPLTNVIHHSGDGRRNTHRSSTGHGNNLTGYYPVYQPVNVLDEFTEEQFHAALQKLQIYQQRNSKSP